MVMIMRMMILNRVNSKQQQQQQQQQAQFQSQSQSQQRNGSTQKPSFQDERHNSNPQQYDDVPIRPSNKQPQPHMNYDDDIPHRPKARECSPQDDSGDALESLSKKYPAARKPSVEDLYSRQQQEQPSTRGSRKTHTEQEQQPEHDTLYQEVKRATGREIREDARPPAPAPAPAVRTGLKAAAPTATGSSVCTRKSSCTCAQCSNGGVGAARTSKNSSLSPPQQQQTTSRNSASSQQEMENSLSLLKSKMSSRRKSRSAPTEIASLFVEPDTSAPTQAHSAREQTSKSHAKDSRHHLHQQQEYDDQQDVDDDVVPTATRQVPRRASQKLQPPPPRIQEEDQEQEDYDGGRHASSSSVVAPRRASQPNPKGAAGGGGGGNVRSSQSLAGFPQSNQPLPPEYPDDHEEKVQCPNCQRNFNASAFDKHERICDKVFTGHRQTFNTAAKRLKDTGIEKIIKKPTSGNTGSKASRRPEDQPIKTKTTEGGWKQQSNALREAMKASRDVSKALKEGKELPPMAPSAPDPSLILCDFCGRRFNDKAAERHIAFCKEKSQRNRGPAPTKKPPMASTSSKQSFSRPKK